MIAKRQEHVDFHMHSTHSDGELSVRDLIDYCVEQGVTAMSITDHDSIEAYEEGREYAAAAGIGFLPGVEISSTWEGRDIHILGYLYEPTHLRLNQTLIHLRDRRRVRAQEIVNRLAVLGLHVDYEALMERSKGGSVGRAHIASILVEQEYVPTFHDAFTRYLGTGTALMDGIDSEKLSPQAAIELILEAGGVPVLAHPGRTNQDGAIESMVECGLRGIETYCHSHNPAGFRKYKEVAKRYGLFCSGGADFHAKREDDRGAPGSLRVPMDVWDRIQETKVKIG
jgi:predicted metal-dependent phosphoesterase TrpH